MGKASKGRHARAHSHFPGQIRVLEVQAAGDPRPRSARPLSLFLPTGASGQCPCPPPTVYVRTNITCPPKGTDAAVKEKTPA